MIMIFAIVMYLITIDAKDKGHVYEYSRQIINGEACLIVIYSKASEVKCTYTIDRKKESE
jgi:hypothetical protein